MYTLYLHDSYNIQRRRFSTIEEAKNFFNSITVPGRYLVTIESSKLDDVIILQRPNQTRKLIIK